MDSEYANWIISSMHKISYNLEEEVNNISAIELINILKAVKVIEATVLAKFN